LKDKGDHGSILFLKKQIKIKNCGSGRDGRKPIPDSGAVFYYVS
jgi:hypothetical protein